MTTTAPATEPPPPAPRVPQGNPDADRAAGLLAELRARVQAARAGVAVLMLAEPDGRVHTLTVGGADADTRFEWGSVTKAFTGSLLARLAAQGRLSLDTPLSQAWPSLRGRPAGAVTLRQLATHHAGWPRLPGHWAMARSVLRNPADPYAAYTAADMDRWMHRWRGPSGGASPGYAYSNLGFGALGRALAVLAGEDVETLLVRELLRPAGAQGASFRGGVVGGVDEQGRAVPPWQLGPFEAAGALRATPRELLALVQAARDARPPFDGAVQQAQAPQGTRGDDGLQTGLGWALTERHGDRVVWHNGGTGGHRSVVGYSRQTGRAVVAAAAGAVELDDLAMQALNPAFALAPEPAPTRPPARGLAAWWRPLLIGSAALMVAVLAVWAWPG